MKTGHMAAIQNAQVGAATDQEIKMVDVGEDSDEDRLARDRLLGVVGSHNLVGTDYTIPRNETGTPGFLIAAIAHFLTHFLTDYSDRKERSAQSL